MDKPTVDSNHELTVATIFGTIGQFNVLQGNYTRIIELGLRLSF